MGDAVTVYRLRHNTDLYRKWMRLSKEARRFVLSEHPDQDITADTYKAAVRKWRKQEKLKLVDNNS